MRDIFKMVRALPKKDATLALKFINKGNIECLKELVNSRIIITKKNISKDHSFIENNPMILDNLYILQSEIYKIYPQVNMADQKEEDIEC